MTRTYHGLVLDQFQERAIEALQEGRSVLVSAPTGTGKTIIADWIVEQALGSGRKVIYTAPIKALSNQKYRDYCRAYGDERVGLVTGDLVVRRDAPCLVMTTEILRNMLLAGEEVHDLVAVILDEIHFLDDRERGTVWEEVLIYLPRSVQVVGLSATLSNLDDFAAWLREVREGPVDVIVEETRAVPLTTVYMSTETGMVTPQEYRRRFKHRRGEPVPEEGSWRRGRRQRGPRGGRGEDRRGPRSRRGSRTSHLDVFAAMRGARLLPYLYFVFSRRDTETLARGLARHLDRSLLDADELARLDARLRRGAAQIGPALDPPLQQLYAAGVAFHHAGLHVQLKALVEELYEAKLIKVLYCTSTFALGINMPARSVVFDGLKKFDGRAVTPLTTREFMQKAGRAGRRGMDEAGTVVIRLDFDDFPELEPVLERYARGRYEPVRSSFSLSWNSVVNLLATHDEAHIRQIVERSFLAWHLSHKAEEQRARARDLSEGRASKKDLQQARDLQSRADNADHRCWREFEARVVWLQQIGYLAEDRAFNAGARVLRHLQISEILMAELVLSGLLEALEMPRLFGLLCATTNELPRHTRSNHRPSQADRRLVREVEAILRSETVLGSDEIAGTRTPFDPDLIPIGTAWAEGRSLEEVLMMIHSDTDISGDIVTGFRRAKDLVTQLRDVYAQDPDRRADLDALVRAVRRDEVEVIG